MLAIDGSVVGVALWLVAAGGLLIGVLGSLLGLNARRRSRTLETRLDQVEAAAKRARERERERARLRAFIEQRVEIGWYLTIENQGQGAARDLTISIDGSSLETCSAIDRGRIDLGELRALGSHGALRVPLSGAPDRLQLDLTWSDGSGEVGFYEAALTRSLPRSDPGQ